MNDPGGKERRERLVVIHTRLCREYGCPAPFFRALDPLSELVASLLSHRTRNADSAAAFAELTRRFKDWESVRDAPVQEIESAVARCTWPEQKAPRIRQVLQEITERRGDLSLEFLRGMELKEARAWLQTLSGVGPKTSAAVLVFSDLRRPALPVDSHHHRVAIRLGLIPATVAVGPSHDLLEDLLPPEWGLQEVYDNHQMLMRHGQQCCYYRNPACDRCPVLDLCPFGQARLRNLARKEDAPAPALPLFPEEEPPQRHRDNNG